MNESDDSFRKFRQKSSEAATKSTCGHTNVKRQTEIEIGFFSFRFQHKSREENFSESTREIPENNLICC